MIHPTRRQPVGPRRRLARARAALALAAAACTAPSGREPARNELSDAQIEQIQEWTSRASRHFPTYVEALQKFGSPDPAAWAEGERMLELVEKLLDRPVEPALRKSLHAEDPVQREAARKTLARRGEIYRHWLSLHPAPEELSARTDEARAAARRARYVRWIKAREAMLALGDDAAVLLMDAFIRMLPRATPDEQMILRDELNACGPRVIPLLVALLDIPPREGSLPLRHQCMILLAGFLDRPEAESAFRRYAKSEDMGTRKLVAESIRTAHLQKRTAAPRAILEPMLRDDPAWEVRAAAAQALGDIGHPEAAPALIDVLQHGSLPSPEDRVSLMKFVVGALGALRAREAVEPLVRVLETETNLDVRRNALKALARITGEYHATPAEWRERLATPPRP